MTSKVLADLLTNHYNCTRDGDVVSTPGGVSLTLYISVASEALIVERVKQLTLTDEMLLLRTSRREQYAVAYQDVRAVRLVDPESGHAGY